MADLPVMIAIQFRCCKENMVKRLVFFFLADSKIFIMTNSNAKTHLLVFRSVRPGTKHQWNTFLPFSSKQLVNWLLTNLNYIRMNLKIIFKITADAIHTQILVCIESNLKCRQWRIYIVKFWTRAPAEISLFSCSFRENLAE